jgi:hypothetical protein
MFTGIDEPYEPLENPEVTVYNERESVVQSAQKIIDALMERNFLKKPVPGKIFCEIFKISLRRWKSWDISS